MHSSRTNPACKRALAASLAALSALLLPPPVRAEDPKPAASAQPAFETTEEGKKEKEFRKACKIKICDAFLNKKTAGDDISCPVLKTWQMETITRIVGKAGVTWPLGHARCKADLKFKRETLVKAVSEPEYEASFDKHTIDCELDKDKDGKGDKYAMKFDINPKVTFKQGKAVKASLGWGNIEAPALVKGAMWSATAVDNTFGVLQGSIVEDINDFIDKKCLEVKDELPK